MHDDNKRRGEVGTPIIERVLSWADGPSVGWPGKETCTTVHVKSWRPLLAMYNSCVRLDLGCGHRPALGMGGSEGGEGGWLCSRRAFFFVVDTRCRHTHSKLLNQANQTI